MSTSESTVSTRAKRNVLVIANPSSDSEDSEEDRQQDTRTNPHAVGHPYCHPSPPSPAAQSPPESEPRKREPSPLNTTNLPRHTHHPSLSNPALSSPTTGTSSPPPTTPAQSLPPTDIHEEPTTSIAPENPTESGAYHQKVSPLHFRGREFIGKIKSHMNMNMHRPHHDRRYSSSSSRQPTSPTSAPSSQPYSARGTHGVRSPNDDKTVIMITGDSDQYHVVDISGFERQSAAFVKELIYSKLRIPDEEQPQYSIYRTEVGAFALSTALSDEQLFSICEQDGDSRGNLRFLVASSYAPVHEPAPNSPTTSSVQPPVLPIPYTGPYMRSRHRSRSRHEGSVSSASERIQGDGYAPSASDEMEDDGHRNTFRPEESHRTTLKPQPYGSSSHTFTSSSPRTPRHVNPPRPSSPDNRAQSPSRYFSPDRGSGNGSHVKGPPRGYKHPQSIMQGPEYPRHDDEGTYRGYPHNRSGSDAAADRDRLGRSEVGRVQDLRRKGAVGRDILADSSSPAPENGQAYRSPKIKPVTPGISPHPPPTPPGVDSRPRGSSRSKQSAVPPQWLNRTGANLKAYRSMDNLRAGFPSALTPGARTMAPPLPSLPQFASSGSRDGLLSLGNGSMNGESSIKSPRRDQSSSNTPSQPPSSLNPGPPPPLLDPSLSSRPGNVSSARNAPRIVRPLPQSGPPQQVHSPDSGYGSGTYMGPTRPQLPPLPTQGTLLSPQNIADPYVRPSSSLGEEPPPVPSPYQPLRQTKPGVFSRPLEEVQSQASTPLYTVRPLPPSHPPPDLVSMSPPSHATRALPIPHRTNSSSTHDQARPSPPRSPASPKSPQTNSQQSYGPLLDASLSPSNGHSYPSHEPLVHNPSLSADDIARLNSIKGMVTQQYNDDGTFIPTMRPKVSLPPIPPPPQLPHELRIGAVPPPPPLPSLSHMSSTPSSGTSTVVPPTPSTPDSNDSDSEAGTLWNVRPVEPARVSRGPPLTVTIEEDKGGVSPQKTSGGSYTTLIPVDVPPMPQVPPPEPPRGVWSGRTPTARKPDPSKTETPDSSWASRPNPEDVIDRLEQYFPNHDLDKPVIEASSGGTSPTAADYPPVAQVPAIANVQAQDRRKHKKSIRIIARERNSHQPREALSGSTFANNVARKRSTKLWDSRVEEVTPAQITTGMAGASPDSPSARKPIFKWVRGELIGKGNFGRVYLAMNVTTGEMIAVKQVEIPRTASDKNDTRQMNVVDALKLESETLKDLDHPHIVQYLGFEETATFLSIFLEYVPGGSIGGCLRKYGRFEENVTKSFTSQILSGLEYLHSKGILHRDMKADNILVEQTGVCKISDFGISKRTDDINGQNVLTAMQGTVFWMAPEVVNTGKRGYNAKVDIWSLGCVVLEMWAGERPWRREEAMAVIVKLYSSKQAPPIPIGVHLTEEADDFRKLCFAVDPDRRPSAAALRKHPYLRLPDDWSFTGFSRQDMARDLEDAETF